MIGIDELLCLNLEVCRLFFDPSILKFYNNVPWVEHVFIYGLFQSVNVCPLIMGYFLVFSLLFFFSTFSVCSICTLNIPISDFSHWFFTGFLLVFHFAYLLLLYVFNFIFQTFH